VGLLTVLTRTAATITVVHLRRRRPAVSQEDHGREIVASSLRRPADRQARPAVGFAVRIFQYAPTLTSFFDMLDAATACARSGARPLAGVAGTCATRT